MTTVETVMLMLILILVVVALFYHKMWMNEIEETKYLNQFNNKLYAQIAEQTERIKKIERLTVQINELDEKIRAYDG